MHFKTLLFILAVIVCLNACSGSGGLAADASIVDCRPLTPFESVNNVEVLADYKIVPEPKVIKDRGSDLQIDNSWTIIVRHESLEDYEIAEKLKDDISEHFGLDLDLKTYTEGDLHDKIIIVETRSPDSYARKILNSKDVDLDGFVGCGQDKLGFGESYILDIGDKIILYGDTPIGTFYASQTLWWIMRSSPSGFLPELIIADWPDHKIRNFFLSKQFDELNNELLYRLKINRLTTYIFPSFFNKPSFLEPEKSDVYSRHVAIEDFRKDHYIKFMPMVDPVYMLPQYTSSDGKIETPELLEGWYVEEEPFVIKNASLVPVIDNDHYISLTTSGDDPQIAWATITGANIYNGGVYSSCKTSWYNVDASLCHSQNHSCIKVSATSADKSLVDEYQEYNESHKDKKYVNEHLGREYEVGNGQYLEPGLYSFEYYAKAHSDLNNDKCTLESVIAVSDDEEENRITYRMSRREDELTGEWHKLIYPFYITNREAVDKAVLSFSVSGYSGCSEAIFYIDDIRIRRLSNKLRNIIKTDVTGIEVVDAVSGVKYVEGIDYKLDGMNTPLPDTYEKLADPFSSKNSPRIVSVEWLKNYNVPEKVLVSYDMLIMPRLGKDYHTIRHNSLSDPLVFELFEEKMIKPLFQASGDNMDEIVFPFDEMRAFNRDSRNLEYGTKLPNWKIFKKFLDKQTEIVNRYRNTISIGVMEMLGLSHNGGHDCYLRNIGQWQDNCGETGLGLAGIDSNRYFFMPWIYGVEDSGRLARDSVSMMKYLGKKYLPQTGLPRSNQDGWASVIMLSDYPSIGLMGNPYGKGSELFWKESGDIYQDFENRLGYMGDYADSAWNAPQTTADLDNVWEYCNGVDDDQNGLVDEGFEGPDPAYYSRDDMVFSSDPFNCGECEKNCYVSSGVRGSCVEGVCYQDLME